MAEYVIADGDDWTGLYINGKLVTEGHSISLKETLDIAVETPPTEVHWREVNLNWLEHFGSLPTNIYDVIWNEDEFVAGDEYDDGDDFEEHF